MSLPETRHEPSDRLVERFLTALEGVDGVGIRVSGPEEARAAILSVLAEHGVSEVLADGTTFFQAAGLEVAAGAAGITWQRVSTETNPSEYREHLVRAGAGITGAHLAVAETGTLVLLSGPSSPRSLSVVPPLHIAVLTEDRIVPDTPALFRSLGEWIQGGHLPSSLNLVTGPSRTADIEHTLVRRVHGPGDLVVVLLPPAVER